MVDWSLWHQIITASQEQRAQRLRQSEERSILLICLNEERNQRLARLDKWKREGPDVRAAGEGMARRRTEIQVSCADIRKKLDQVAQRLLRAEARLASADEHFTRAAENSMSAEECLQRVEERILQFKSEQIEQQIENEATNSLVE